MNRHDVFLLVATVLLAGVFLPQAEAAEPIPSSEFFRHYNYQRAQINPAGDLIAFDVIEEGRNKLRIINLDELAGIDVFSGNLGLGGFIRSFQWIDDDTVVFKAGSGTAADTFVGHWNGIDPEGKPRAEGGKLNVKGFLVDPLINEENVFLLGTRSPFDRSSTAVYQMDLASGRFLRRRENIVAGGLDGVIHWVSDENGVVRLAVSRGDDDGSREYWHRSGRDDGWEKFETIAGDAILTPVAFTDEPGIIHVLSNVDRETVALLEFDMEAAEFGEVVFELPGVDLTAAIQDWDSRRARGVVYEQHGQREQRYFDPDATEAQEALSEVFDESVAIVSESRDADHVIALVQGDTNPGTFYQYHRDEGEAELLASRAPWIDTDNLASTVTGTAMSTDDLEIPYFLTLPPGEEAAYPLLVMPHGGPYGVRDRVGYDPAVQFFANRGFAVLRMNYRGSSGYGKSFLEAGKQQWGEGIEDDIQAVMETVFERHPVSRERVCTVGSSYGGYSALMNVIRSPESFQCAASFAGVTDIALLFSSSDWAQSNKGIEGAKEVIGDVETDYRDMMDRSPVYRADDIQVPVFLAHGAEDERVDVEHAHRMKMMLDLLEKPYEWHIFDEEGHGFSSFENRIEYHDQLAVFLAEQLDVELPEFEESEEETEAE